MSLLELFLFFRNFCSADTLYDVDARSLERNTRRLGTIARHDTHESTDLVVICIIFLSDGVKLERQGMHALGAWGGEF